MNYTRSILFLLLGCAISMTSFSQNAAAFLGSWEGKLGMGINLRLILKVNQTEPGKIQTYFFSPDQTRDSMLADATTINDNTISASLAAMQVTFEGKLVNDSTIDGTFTQGIGIPVQLKKITQQDASAPRSDRPQTPKPPYPYLSEDVFYSNPDKSIRFGATLTIPAGKGPHPAVILISGSGAQDRNSELIGHQLFAVVADHLTRNGFIVLRYDERGVGKSGGKFEGATSADFADDVSAGVDYLLSRAEVDKNRIGLVGHSEGGMIAPMVSSKRNEISFLVLMAAPGVQAVEMMAEQNHAIAKSNGLGQEALKEIKPLFRSVVQLIQQEKDSLAAESKVIDWLENWTINKSIVLLEEMTLASRAQRTQYAKAMVGQLKMRWFEYFVQFDPGIYLEKMKVKILAINGDKDIQVIASQNLEGIRNSLKKSKSKFDIVTLPGMNHLFQVCKLCTLDEYGQLEESFSPIALQTISDWLRKNIL